MGQPKSFANWCLGNVNLESHHLCFHPKYLQLTLSNHMSYTMFVHVQDCVMLFSVADLSFGSTQKPSIVCDQ